MTVFRQLLVSVCFVALEAFGSLQAQTNSQQSNPPTQQDQMQQDQTTTGTQPGIASTDQDFIQRAYDDNRAEINLGQIAARQASSDAVKNFALSVVNDHQQANQQLQQIASDKGITLQSSQNTTSDQSLATASGRDFDHQYIQRQQDELNNELSLFQQEASSGQDPTVKSFAATRLSQLQSEVQMADNVSS